MVKRILRLERVDITETVTGNLVHKAVDCSVGEN